MSNVSQIKPADERKERRRLHLREIAQETNSSDATETTDADTPEGEAAAPVQAKETVGAALRAARVARGEDDAKVAAALKMRRDQLRAVEESDFDRLPGRTYAVGFVRAYARYLGLDAEGLVQRFKDENASAEPFAKPVEHAFPEAATEPGRMPNGSILIWALLIAMLIYAISYLTLPARKSPTATAAKAEESSVIIEQPKAAPNPAPAVRPQPSAPAAEDAAAPAPQALPEEASPGFVGGAKMLPATPDEPKGRSPFLGDAPAPPAFKVAEVVQSAENQSHFETAAAGQMATAQPSPKPQGLRVAFKALEPTYIQIKDPNRPEGRTVLVSRVLAAGDSYVPPDRDGLVMQTGNAGGLQVEVDGHVMGVMGKSGEVISRMPLDASYFLEHFAAAQ